MLEGEYIDSLCDRFEAELRRGASPTLVDFLEPAPPAARRRLLYELLVTEIEFKVRRGFSLYVDETVLRFPAHEDVVLEAFQSFVWEGNSESGSVWRHQAGTHLMLRHFRLKALIGRGAFGNVWLADDTRLDREVAIKTCHAYDGVQPRELENALCEAHAAAALRHANILPIYEINEQEGNWFLVAAHAPNGTLQQLINSNPPTLEEAARLLSKLAEALSHAHSKGVCHRDLKPSNILMDGHGEPLIADFGLATSLRRPGDVQPGLICGTRKYMAPEQLQGRFGGERADLYSLGVILEDLLEAAARAHPKNSKGLPGRLTRMQRRLVRRSMELIRLKCTQLDPSERYASARSLAEDFRRVSTSRPPRHVAMGWKSQAQWFACRNVTAIGTGLAGSAAALAIAALSGDAPPPNARRVRVTSEPAGCEVVVVALDKLTGEPDPGRILTARRTPAEMYLIPGDYLVEVIQDDKHFQEAPRHVPESSENFGFSARYRSWKEIDGIIHLPTVYVASSVNEEELVGVPETSDLLVSASSESNNVAERLRVPAFQAYKHAFTTGLGHGPGAYALDFVGPILPRQTFLLSYDDAVLSAEMKGLRLPSAAEWCAILSRSGEGDATDFGIESPLALWTSSRMGSPGTGLRPAAEHPHNWSGRLLVKQTVNASQNPLGERVIHPTFLERDGRSRTPETGFIGVRSARPRRRPEDFASSVPHLMTASGSPLSLSTTP